MSDIIVVHYHEIALKKRNRAYFEAKLRENIRRALKGTHPGPVRRRSGRATIELTPESHTAEILARLRYVFGIVHYALGRQVVPSLDELQRVAGELLAEQSFDSFCVRARRSDKAFPLTSPEIERQVGAYLVARLGKRVDLTHPDVTCRLEIVNRAAYVFTEKLPGPGGLPVGSGGRLACLLSGGIDSPVAAYKLMRRGGRLVFIHFHAHPFTDCSSQEIARELVEVLTRYQFHSRLHLVPFGEIQRAISLSCPPPLRIVLYRRMMMRLAEALGRREGARALVTGESLGQVASQTLDNLASIDDAATMPVLRPLIGEDKPTIVELAQAIGTFGLSTTPCVEDCCPLFMPANPATRSQLEEVRQAEEALAMDVLQKQALAETKVEVVDVPA